MPDQRTLRPLSTKVYLALLLLILGLFVAYQAGTWDKPYWEYDEGLNVIKAQLVAEGYWPHRDIWSDQPPLLTLLLRVFFGLFGWEISVGRAFMTLWAVLLLLATALASRAVAGRRTALIATALLALSPMVQELGRTILIGLPAVAMGTLSIAVAYRAMQRDQIWGYVLAGTLFALGMLIKPLIAPYYAALILTIFWPFRHSTEKGDGVRSTWWFRALALNVVPALLLGATLLLFGPREFLDQVLGTFFTARDTYGFSLGSSMASVAGSFSLGYYPGLFVSALLMLVLLVKRDWRLAVLLAGWLGISVTAVLFHTPQRWHEHLLLLPPACVLTALLTRYTLAPLAARRTSTWQRPRAWAFAWATLAFVAVGVVGMGRESLSTRAYPLREGNQAEATQLALDLLNDEVPKGSLIITDDPMLAFATGNTVPPFIAVSSQRRIYTGGISADDLIQTCEEQTVGAVVLWWERLYQIQPFFEWVRTHMALRAERPLRWFYEPIDPTAPQEARSADGLAFLGSTLVTHSVDPDGEIEVRLFWHADSAISEHYTLFVHLVDDEGQSWGQQDAIPFRATERWQEGDSIVEKVVLTVAEDAPPGPKHLSVGWYDIERHRLTFYDGEGNELPGGQITLGEQPVVRWKAQMEAPVPQVSLDAALGDVAQLIGYDLAIVQGDAGPTAELTLYWQAMAEAPNRYKVFVHCNDAADTVVAQSDSEPAGGARPTSGWRTGEYITDTHAIALPADGSHLSIYVGMYDAETVARLPASVQGERQLNDRIYLQQTADAAAE